VTEVEANLPRRGWVLAEPIFYHPANRFYGWLVSDRSERRQLPVYGLSSHELLLDPPDKGLAAQKRRGHYLVQQTSQLLRFPRRASLCPCRAARVLTSSGCSST